MRSFLLKSIGPLLVSLITCELVLYMLDYPRWWHLSIAQGNLDASTISHQSAGWVRRAGTYSLLEEARQIVQTFPHDGVRASAPADFDARKAAADVLLLGDSFVEGFGVGDEDTFAWKLQARRPDLRVTNMGTGGYGTLHAMLRLEALADYERPRTSTVHVVHLLSEFNEERNVGAVSSLRLYHPNSLGNGLRLPFVASLAGGAQVTYSPGELVWSPSRYIRTSALVEDAVKNMQRSSRLGVRRPATFELLRRMAATCRARGWKFVVMWLDGSIAAADEYRAALLEDGVPLIDLALRDLFDERYRQPDGHPNGTLHSIIAERLAEVLKLDSEHAGRE
jgi:hypothetical protein